MQRTYPSLDTLVGGTPLYLHIGTLPRIALPALFTLCGGIVVHVTVDMMSYIGMLMGAASTGCCSACGSARFPSECSVSEDGQGVDLLACLCRMGEHNTT